ncbi:Scn3a [Symbiodinium sp. CCMP2456]|nr:Scn3a [Symbiodinium sp. CCMP2456]
MPNTKVVDLVDEVLRPRREHLLEQVRAWVNDLEAEIELRLLHADFHKENKGAGSDGGEGSTDLAHAKTSHSRRMSLSRPGVETANAGHSYMSASYQHAKAKGSRFHFHRKIRFKKESINLKRQLSQLSSLRQMVRSLVSHPLFDLFFALVIISNAVYLGIRVESMDPRFPPTQASTLPVQLTYGIVFSLEVLLRLFAAGPAEYACGSDWTWNWLDVAVVVSSWATIVIDFVFQGGDAGISSSIRMVRIIRASRLLRILRTVWVIRFIGALRTLVASLVDTLRSLFWALLLLFLIIYVFGILFTDIALEYVQENYQANGEIDLNLMKYFGSLYNSTATLFRAISGGLDWDDAAESLNPAGWLWVQAFHFYVAFVSFAVLNVMTGVFCNSAIKSAERDMKAKLEDRHDFRALMMSIFKQIDASGDGKLTLTEFETLFDSEAMKALMETADIKAADAWSLFASLDQDGDSLVDVNEFIERCLELHGPARALDLHTLTLQTMKFGEQLAAIEKAQQQQLRFSTFPAQNRSAPQDDTICM